MDRDTFARAFEASTELSTDELRRRFKLAFERTRDIHTAMACVNEMVSVPLSYEALVMRINEAA